MIFVTHIRYEYYYIFNSFVCFIYFLHIKNVTFMITNVIVYQNMSFVEQQAQDDYVVELTSFSFILLIL